MLVFGPQSRVHFAAIFPPVILILMYIICDDTRLQHEIRFSHLDLGSPSSLKDFQFKSISSFALKLNGNRRAGAGISMLAMEASTSSR